MKKLVGIDDLTTYVPKTYLELVPEYEARKGNYVDSEFSRLRGIPPSRIAKGIGVYQFGWPDGHEDSVTMGAMAFKKLIEKNDLRLSDIGRVFVGTESAVDHSKPNAMFIVGAVERALGKEGETRNYTPLDLKFACAGATAGLELMSEWIETGKNNGKAGVVIATDVSHYLLGTKEKESIEEITQGAGAVAMLVKENPRLLALENSMTTEITSTVCKDEKDFFRPLYRHSAVVDGQLSVDCYLNACKAALTDYRKKAVTQGFVKDEELLTDKFDRILVHLPFHKMGEYAGVSLFRHEWRNTPRFREIEREIGPEPSIEDVKADKEFARKFRETKLFKEVFSEKMEKGLAASERTGNLYTGSLYAALSSMLELESKQGTDIGGMRFAFGSYGSGLMFKAFTGIVQPGFKEVIGKLDLLKTLDERGTDKRISLSVAEYERLHEKNSGMAESVLPPKNEFVLASIGTSKVDEGYRYYKFVD